MTAVQRVLLPDTNQSPVHVIKGIQVANDLCRELGIADVIFLIPTKDSLTSGPLHNALGADLHNSLEKGKPVKLPCGARMRCEAVTTLKWLSSPSVVIAVFAGQNMMDKIDSLQNLAAVVAVPWTPDAIEGWVKTWSPKVLAEPTKPGKPANAKPKLIADPVVEQAMKSLTTVANRANNTMHPADEDYANGIFRILRAHNHGEPAENIKLWAISNGWLPKTAARMEVLAEKAFGLSTKPKLDNPEQAAQLYKRWSDATMS